MFKFKDGGPVLVFGLQSRMMNDHSINVERQFGGDLFEDNLLGSHRNGRRERSSKEAV